MRNGVEREPVFRAGRMYVFRVLSAVRAAPN
jgi:hypothetical protein